MPIPTFPFLFQEKVIQGDKELSLNEMLNLLQGEKDANKN